MTIEKKLMQGFKNSQIDRSQYQGNLAYESQFISNDPTKGTKVLSVIESGLKNCKEFYISVAFITMSGLAPLLQVLKELERREIPGKILTTDYLNFSEPRALKKLSELKNLEVRLYETSGQKEGFHTKGYIFKKEELYQIIIGSSNMTQQALTINKEWNTKIVSLKQGGIAQDVLGEFNDLWNSSKTKYLTQEVLEQYKLRYQVIQEQKKSIASSRIPDLMAYRLEPNSMQIHFIKNLEQLIMNAQDKALLISATGTGKTYASAFAMRHLNFKRVLFLVHRNQLAKQAKVSYSKVFADKVTYGLVDGNHKEFDKDYIFATVQTLGQNLQRFSPTHFDAIIYDEAHHASATMHRKIMDYFKPKLSLGMTATPDKRDMRKENDIYELFDHNIVYEIRLQEAMKEDLLCPFHYFGIADEPHVADLGMEDKEVPFRYLTSDERVKHVMQQANYYGYSGERVKGLIFCSTIAEANELSVKFNQAGWRTAVLTGQDSDVIRMQTIERLVKKQGPDTLDYILSVDVFSEGVDIVEINQVIMLRPTESPIVFTQQLGRGLRKDDDKEFLVVLDFIGNYKNNFMIPIALSGDRSYNKDNIRRYLLEGTRVVPGCSTIHFDEISKKRIFTAIDNANFSDLKLLKQNYFNLKDKLGRIPHLQEFDEFGEMDVLRIFDNNSLGSYYMFLKKYEPDFKAILPNDAEEMLRYVSKKFASGKRVHELELLRIMLVEEHNLLAKLTLALKEQYQCEMDANCRVNIINQMTNNFLTGTGKNTYTQSIFIEPDDKDPHDYQIAKQFKRLLEDQVFYSLMKELIDFGIARYEQNYSDRYQDTNFVLYQKYTYEDVCRLLNWEFNEVSVNIGGYKFNEKTKTFPVFINYDKEEDLADTTKYEDRFLSANHLIAISKSGRTLASSDVQKFLNSQKEGISVQLFVRKNKDDKISKEFYYLGKMTPTQFVKEFTMPNTTKTAVEIGWHLENEIREDLYEYIISK